MDTKVARGLTPVIHEVSGAFKQALQNAFPDFGEKLTPIVVNANPAFGDYQCNNAMQIFKEYKSTLGVKSPKEVGELIGKAVKEMMEGKEGEGKEEGKTDSLFSSVVVAPQGFVTVKLNDEWLSSRVSREILGKEKLECEIGAKGTKLLIDFSSPNIAKEMHVGHLRSTIIGESLARTFEFVGYTVQRVNHLGDWGTQFGMLIEYMFEKYPDFEKNLPKLSSLTEFYKESKKRFDEDEAFKTRARERVVKLQGGEENTINAWKMLVQLSLNEFSQIYQRLDITVSPRGESFYNPMLPEMVTKLTDAGVVEEVEGGALCVWPEADPAKRADNDIPLILKKADGGFGYDGTDIATIYHRFHIDMNDINIYVVDVGQSLHFDLVFGVAERLGWLNRGFTKEGKRLQPIFVGFGLVCGDDGKKFKTRSGDTVKLVSLLDEARDRALAQIRTRRAAEALEGEALEGEAHGDAQGDAQGEAQGDAEGEAQAKAQDKTVDQEATGEATAEATAEEASAEDLAAAGAMGYAAVKYFDLRQRRTTNYKFSYEKMLDPKGNTAVYLLYAYARTSAIFQKAGISPEEFEAQVLKEAQKEAQAETSSLLPAPEAGPERTLIMTMLKFPETVESILSDMSLHHLCSFTFELSSMFSDFYQACRIIGHPREQYRLYLTLAFRKVLKQAFYLLGIKPLDRI